MSGEQKQCRERTEEESETQSRTSLDAANAISDKNEAASLSSRAHSVGTVTVAEKPPQEGGSEQAPKATTLPSHSPLAFANYPPYWSNDSTGRPKPRGSASSPQTLSRNENGFSVDTLNAVMATSSKDPPGKRFVVKDPTNRHQYLQRPDPPSSRAQINLFGRSIGGLGKPPSLLSFKRQKGK